MFVMGGRKVPPLLFRLMFVILIVYCLLSLLPHIFDLQYSNIKDRHGWVLQWHQERNHIFVLYIIIAINYYYDCDCEIIPGYV